MSIQGSVGINRPLWHCLAGDRYELHDMLKRGCCLQIKLSTPRCMDCKCSVLVRSYSGHLTEIKAGWGSSPQCQLLLHASEEKTVNITQAPSIGGGGGVTRPSESLNAILRHRKRCDGTATECVPRGHLGPYGYGGSIYSRANVRANFNDPSVIIWRSGHEKGVAPEPSEHIGCTSMPICEKISSLACAADGIAVCGG